MAVKSRILSSSLPDLVLAAQALRSGDLVALPTETVYGLAANALDPQAVLKIFEAKERPHFDPLIVHVLPNSVAELERLGLLDSERLTLPLRKIAQGLMDAFWPGPLTLVLPRNSDRIPDLVTSGLQSVALRCPSHPVMRQVLELAEIPLAAPSANRFGRISPTQASHVSSELDGRIHWIVDGGATNIGIESTVLALSSETPQAPQLLRPGGLDVLRISEVLRHLGATLQTDRPVAQGNPATSPGMLPSHYAPSKPLKLIGGLAQFDQWNIPTSTRQIGFLAWSGHEDQIRAQLSQAFPQVRGVYVQILSNTGNPLEAARQLFALLRKLDDSAAELLFAQEVPQAVCASSGIALAIQDRLQRAAFRAESE